MRLKYEPSSEPLHFCKVVLLTAAKDVHPLGYGRSYVVQVLQVVQIILLGLGLRV